jgi:hypothetical protein
MTKQSAETVKCRNGGLYSIAKQRSNVLISEVPRRQSTKTEAYILYCKTTQEMYTWLGDLQSSCSVDGGKHSGWWKSHYRVYNPTQQAPKLTLRDTHQPIFHHRLFLKPHWGSGHLFVLIFSWFTFLRCQWKKSTNCASFVDTICGGASDNSVRLTGVSSEGGNKLTSISSKGGNKHCASSNSGMY